MWRILLVAVCLLQSTVWSQDLSPEDAVKSAAVWVKTSGGSALNFRFFSLYNLEDQSTRTTKTGLPEDYSPHDEGVKTLLLTVNLLNRVNPQCDLIYINDSLYALHMEAPGWDYQSWEHFGQFTTYFRAEWSNLEDWNTLVAGTGSNYPIVRLDEFIVKATAPPHYYNFLFGFDKVKTKAELYKTLGVDEEFVANFNLQKAAAKKDSEVTHHNRRLEFRPGPFDVWTSHDTESDGGDSNVFRRAGQIPGKQHELKIVGNEHIFFLSNGLIGGFLNDANGNRIEKVPPNVASDKTFGTRDVSVFAGRNCISCHSEGIRPLEDDFSKLLKSGAIELWTTDAKGQRILKSAYDPLRLQQVVQEGQNRYHTAVQSIVNTNGEKIANQYRLLVTKYIEGHLTLEDAAREAGLSPTEFLTTIKPPKKEGQSDEDYRKTYVSTTDPTLQELVPQENIGNEWISRSAWESSYSNLMLMRHRPGYVYTLPQAVETTETTLKPGENQIEVTKGNPIVTFDSNVKADVKIGEGKVSGEKYLYPVTVSEKVEWIELTLKNGSKERFKVKR